MVIARSMRFSSEKKGGTLSSAINQMRDIPGVSRLILFGTYIKRNQTLENDIDIAVFFDTESASQQEEYRKLAKICRHPELDTQIAVFFNTEKTCLIEEYRQLAKICREAQVDIRVQVFHDYDLREPCNVLEEIVTYGIDLPLILN